MGYTPFELAKENIALCSVSELKMLASIIEIQLEPKEFEEAWEQSFSRHEQFPTGSFRVGPNTEIKQSKQQSQKTRKRRKT